MQNEHFRSERPAGRNFETSRAFRRRSETLVSNRCFVAIVLYLIVASPPANAFQDDPPFVLTRLAGSIRLDGFSDEPAWQTVNPLPLTVHQPVFGAEPTERTEIRVGYDDQYLYVSGRLYDSDPGGIRANSLYRDHYSGDDTFALVLDPFNDNENGLWFFTTPAGVRFDWAISNDANSGGSSFNDAWNTYWDVATVRTQEGWFAEMRFPFSSLGFEDVDGRVTMGLSTYRYIARKSERHLFPAIPPDWDFAYAKPSKTRAVVLDGVHSQKPLHLTPYALGGFGQRAQLDNAKNAFHLNDDLTEELGFDLKYSLTSNLTFDATVNTDFAQVEADDQQVNLTRFSLFFPEKRQFFQERAGIFDFNTSGDSRLFHSRRIGLSGGEAIRILGGTRLVGRMGGWDVGVIDMQTERHSNIPSENFGVARLRRQILNQQSHTGAMVTSRIGDDGSYNISYGLDGILRVTGDEYVTVKWAQTFDEDPTEAGDYRPLQAGRLLVDWSRRRREGFHYNGGVVWSGKDFDPGIGFVLRNDFTQINAGLIYDYFADAAGSIRRIQPWLWGKGFFRNVDGVLESATLQHVLTVQTMKGDEIRAGPTLWHEDVPHEFALSDDANVPAGKYTFWDFWLGGRGAAGRLFRFNWDLRGGTFYDGWRGEVRWEPTWNLSQHLTLSGEYELNLVRFPDRDQRFDVHIGRLRIQAALDTQISFNSFLQYNSAANLLSMNMRFRYNLREGNDLWIVYDHGLNTDRHRVEPKLLLTNDRTVLVKYTHTFSL